MQDRTGRGLRSRPVRRRSQLEVAGREPHPAGHSSLEDSWLVTLGAQCAALPQRKFVWDRTLGSSGAGDVGVDLLAPFRGQPGATHLGATVMRIRGYIVPSEVFDVTGGAGVCGIRVDTWNTDVTDLNNQPFPAARLRLDGLAPVERGCHRTYCPSHQHHLEPVRL